MCFCFHLSHLYIVNSFLVHPLVRIIYNCVSFQRSVYFINIVELFISSLITWVSDNMFCMTWILFNLLRLVILLKVLSILINVFLCSWKYGFWYYWVKCYINVSGSSWLMMLKSWFLLILLTCSTNNWKKGIKIFNYTWGFVYFPCNSIVASVYFASLILDTLNFRIMCPFDKLTTLS